MNPVVNRLIRELALNVSDADQDRLLDGWRGYFTAFDIPEDMQVVEFRSIMRARVQSGQVSLVAPRGLDG